MFDSFVAHQMYYCLIQFRPDIGRAEAVNVGVALFDVSTHAVLTRVIERNDVVMQRFPGCDKRLSSERQAFINRLHDAVFDCREHIEAFIGCEMGRLALTPLRTVNCDGRCNQCLDDLYMQYVEST